VIIPLSDLELSANEITNRIVDELSDFAICIRLNSGKMSAKYSSYYMSYKDIIRANEGISDLILILPNGDSLWLEIKAKRDKQRKSQALFEKILKELGHTYKMVGQSDMFDFCKRLRKIYGK